MLISELAERTGLTAHTIRYYEKEGLLGEEHRHRSANNYRSYNEEAVTRLTLIKTGQAAGFTLSEIRALIDVWESGALTIEEQKAIIHRKIESIDEKITQLEAMKSYLLSKVALISEGIRVE